MVKCMNQSYRPVMTCSNVQWSCDGLTCMTCWQNHFSASPSKNSGMARTCFKLHSPPPYCMAWSITVNFVSQSLSSWYCGDHLYCQMVLMSVQCSTGCRKEYQWKKYLENILILILFQCVYLITRYGEKYYTLFYHNENLIIVQTFRITCHKIW